MERRTHLPRGVCQNWNAFQLALKHYNMHTEKISSRKSAISSLVSFICSIRLLQTHYVLDNRMLKTKHMIFLCFFFPTAHCGCKDIKGRRKVEIA